MSSPNVIDFQARLRDRQNLGSPVRKGRHLYLDNIFVLEDDPAALDDAALTVRLVLGLSREHGRDYEKLPQLVRVALDDLCADGNAACRLVRSWLLGQALADERPANPQPLTNVGDRVFRHNRFWKPGSQWLQQADERRRAKLLSLLTEVERGE